MRKLDVYKEFTFGTGTGEDDLRIIGMQPREDYSDIDTEGLLGSGEIVEEIKGNVGYLQNTNLMITPGYFYVGDRECYAYSKKFTQMSKPTVCSGEIGDPYPVGTRYIPLMEVPFGISEFTLPDEVNLCGTKVPNTGVSPLNISRFAPGVLTAREALWDTVIEHDSGVNQVLGYRARPIIGVLTVLPGEDAQWPMHYSPLSRYTVLPSYWRPNEPMLLQNLFYYDFEYNSIVLYDSGTVDSEYLIEFEGQNEPFKIKEIDLSPLESWPESSILCLSTDKSNTVFKEDPYAVVLHLPKTSVRKEQHAIAAEVRSIKGNRLEGERVRFRIVRKDVALMRTQLEDLDGFVPGSPYCILSEGLLSGVVIDRVEFPSGEIYEGDVLITDAYRIDGQAYVRSAGFLCNPQGALPIDSGILPECGNYELEAVTDRNGIALVVYTSPLTVSSSFDIEVQAEVLNVSGVASAASMTLLSEEEDMLYALPLNNLWREVQASGEVNLSGGFVVRLPVDCIAPSSAKVVTLRAYMGALFDGSDIPFEYPDRIDSGCVVNSGETILVDYLNITGEISVPWRNDTRYCEAVYSGFSPGSDVVILRYLDSNKITRGDARDQYGI